MKQAVWRTYPIRVEKEEGGFVEYAVHGPTDGLWGVRWTYVGESRFVLSHIASGFAIAEFREAANAFRVWDYLSENLEDVATEIAAMNASIEEITVAAARRFGNDEKFATFLRSVKEEDAMSAIVPWFEGPTLEPTPNGH